MSKLGRSERTRVAVVDDHPLMREGIAQALGRAVDFDVVAVGQSADDAIRIAAELQPDVLLLDVNMPGDGLAALETITREHRDIACVVMTVREDEVTLRQAMRGGARGYVLKGINGADLIDVIRAIDSGDVYVTPTLAANILARHPTPSIEAAGSADMRLKSLTEREVMILNHLAQGKTNKEIGSQLEISEKTVKHYVTIILQKLQVRNRVEAALIARGRTEDPM